MGLVNPEGAKAQVNPDLAKKVSGREPPHRFPTIDATVLELAEAHKIISDDVKLNRIVFQFPAGFNKLDLFEECRALTLLDDFQTMYDITMQMLVGKDLVINMRQNDGTLTVMESFHITDKFQNLRAIPSIDKYPVLITWLTEFIAADLRKKYPLPGNEAPRQTTEKKRKRGTKKESTKPE